MPRPDEHGVRAPAQRLGAAHGRPDAELTGGVVRGRDDPTAARIAADDERPRAQLGLLELLDRREEGVEVEMRDDHASAAGERRDLAGRGR